MISKLYSEVKHRSLKYYNIIDIRIFSYFSQFIELDSNFFMTEIVNSIIEKKLFKTNNIDIIRDYVHPEDLFQLISLIIKKDFVNDFFDVYSKKEIKKSEIIEIYKKRYNLNVEIENNNFCSITGNKNLYYSNLKKAQKELGYLPNYTSEETIIDQTEKLLRNII